MTEHRPEVRPGVVSVVTINFRGAEDTIACLSSLGAMDWPAERLELICVENASGDDSAVRIRTAHPGVTLIESRLNTGFAGGCNFGVSRAAGEYIAFLNNDARAHPDWLAAAVRELEADPTVACVASKVLDWEGAAVDYVDGGLTWYGMGYKPEVGKPDKGAWDEPKDVLFATGAAMVVRADLFRAVGGFDERFFMFYEDVDFGWRLNLLGHRVRYVPASIAYHRHHATINKFGSWRERFLLERNALMSFYKNVEDETLAHAFAPVLALAVRRGIAFGGDDPTLLDLQRSPGREEEERVAVTKTSLTGSYAVDQFVANLPSLRESRRGLQRDRRRSDGDLIPLFRNAMVPAYTDDYYLVGYHAIVSAFEIAEIFGAPRPAAAGVEDIDTSGKSAGELLEDFRRLAADRAERITALVEIAQSERVRAEKAGRRAKKAEARADALRRQLTTLQGRPGGRGRSLGRKVRRRIGRIVPRARAAGGKDRR